MDNELLREASTGWSCYNALVALSIRAGDPVDPNELIELSSNAKTVSSLVTLVCRGHDRILDCQRLWKNALEMFGRARTAWTDVPIDRDPLVRFYSLQLQRLCELSEAQVDLYSVTLPERLEHASRKADAASDSTDEPKEELAKRLDRYAARSHLLAGPDLNRLAVWIKHRDFKGG
jgi:hypothetical protein